MDRQIFVINKKKASFLAILLAFSKDRSFLLDNRDFVGHKAKRPNGV